MERPTTNEPSPQRPPYRPVTWELRPRDLRGIELRYVVVDLIDRGDRRVWTVGELVAELERAGFLTADRMSRAISDGMRAEVNRGRVVRIARGAYRSGHIPGGTRRRMRAWAQRARARAGAAAADDERAVRSAG